MSPLESLQQRIAPLKAALLSHPLYREIDRLEALQAFMEHHVFAVWDFMSLLKELQRRLCCVDVPWVPAAEAANCRLINEIVLAEESDDDGQGRFLSHFELYRRAMIGCGAKTASIDGLLLQLRQGRPLPAALEEAGAPGCVVRFVRTTFACIETGDLAAIAAAFTFGREDLLPAVFQRIVDELNVQTSGGLEEFKYYLDRHISLDGDEHGPLAHKLVLSLCGSDAARWQAAEEAAVNSLAARQELWNGIQAAIRKIVAPRSAADTLNSAFRV